MYIMCMCTFASDVGGAPLGVCLPGLGLHSVLAVASLLAHVNTTLPMLTNTLCAGGFVVARVGCGEFALLGASFVLLLMVQLFMFVYSMYIYVCVFFYYYYIIAINTFSLLYRYHIYFFLSKQ